jgi:hypothetical protein
MDARIKSGHDDSGKGRLPCLRRTAGTPSLRQPTISLSLKKKAISCFAVSGASEPCTEFSPSERANSFRMVPGAASLGLVAPITSRFLAIKHLHHDRAGDHEIHELAVERPLLVDRIKTLGLLARHANAPLRDDSQPRGLELVDDLAGEVPLGRVGLDDREGAFDCHGSIRCSLKVRGL